VLNGFDISRYQEGINLWAVPSDFVIVQHSCGNYIEPTFEAQVSGALRAGKKLGLYHFITGSDGEIETFVNGIKSYAGKAVVALDWETGGGLNSRWGDWDYLREFIEAIQKNLGVNPLLYASADVYSQLRDLGSETNCGLWIAQYADDDPTGYQSEPWNEGAYDMALYQYTSTGRLPGWGGDLDLDLFYGNVNAWDAYAKSSLDQPKPMPKRSTDYEISEAALEANKGVMPVGEKVVILNTANEGLYLTSHNGGLEMTTDPMPWFIQRNDDNSISLADPWGNWITVPSDVKDGDLPAVLKGNGSKEQRWMASSYNGGIKLTCLINSNMNLDLPQDRDAEGQRVQVWWKWTTGKPCPNQTWIVKPYSEILEAQKASADIKPKAEPATPAKAETKPAPKVEPKIAEKTQPKPIEAKPASAPQPIKKTEAVKPETKEEKVNSTDDKDDKNVRIIADLKDLSDISKSEDAEVGEDVAGVVQSMFHTKKATKKMANWIFIIGSVFALAAAVLLILSGCHILPSSGGVIAGIISTVFSAFAHSMGITIVKTK
jgi:GH25 family lysozyme M1 (1,4-beta-N-acetylmuramidase)